MCQLGLILKRPPHQWCATKSIVFTTWISNNVNLSLVKSRQLQLVMTLTIGRLQANTITPGTASGYPRALFKFYPSWSTTSRLHGPPSRRLSSTCLKPSDAPGCSTSGARCPVYDRPHSETARTQHALHAGRSGSRRGDCRQQPRGRHRFRIGNRSGTMAYALARAHTTRTHRLRAY